MLPTILQAGNIVQQFIKQLPCDGIDPCRLALLALGQPVVGDRIALVVGRRCRPQLPALGQCPPHGGMIDPNAADLQHVHHVAHVELILLQLLAIQNVADDRQHLGFGLAAVVVDDPPQGLRRQEPRGEPQAALLPGRERASLQKEQQPRDFGLHPGEQLLVVVRQRRDTPHPVAGLRRLDQHGIALVVGAQHELPEELHLPAIASLCLGLVAAGRREVLDPFGVFAAVEQHLIHTDQQLARPVVVELRTEPTPNRE